MEKKEKTAGYIRLLSILLSNAVMVYGVLYLNWNFFMILYSYWFGEFISCVFDKIKYRTLKNRNELPALKENKETPGKLFFLFIYWIFIVVIAGFIAAPDKTWGENLLVLLFLNKLFNLNLLFVFLGELGILLKDFILSRNYDAKNIVNENNMITKKTMIMHLSVIAGIFIWLAMNTDKLFFHIDAGNYGTYGFMLAFVAIRLVGDLTAMKKNFN